MCRACDSYLSERVEVGAFWEDEEVIRLSRVLVVGEHIIHVTLVFIPRPLQEDKSTLLHPPA